MRVIVIDKSWISNDQVDDAETLVWCSTKETKCMRFNQRGNISSLKGGPMKLVDKFTYLESCVSSTETYINTRLAKACTANDSLLVIWKSDLTDKIKRVFFFQAAVVSILQYGCTT